MRSVIVASAVLLMSSSAAHACSCGGGFGPACEEAWSKYTAAVFLGRAESINTNWLSGTKRVDFAVEEYFLGGAGREVSVTTEANEAACGYSFVEGERYVVYAGKTAEGKLHVSLCSHTRPAKYAEEDVSYFQTLNSLPKTATIRGTLWRYTHDPNFKPKFQPSLMDHYRPPEQEYVAMKPVPGAKVVAKASDGTEHIATVATDGNWKISGLAPGSYTVTPRLQDSIFVHPYRAKVATAPKGCAHVDIRVESNGRIAGEVDYGAPEPDWALIKVFAVPLHEQNVRRPASEIDLEAKENAFELAPLQPGEYILGVYVIKEVSVKNGYTLRDTEPTYYPGVTDRKLAVPVVVAEGKKTNVAKFKIVKRPLIPE